MPHAFATAASRRFQHYRIAESNGRFARLFIVAQRLRSAGNNGHARLDCGAPRARFRRKKSKEDLEIARRGLLLRAGRIGEAMVLGADEDGDSNLILSYSYTIGGVDYQAFQKLDAEQRLRESDYLPGARVALRYDPHRPANSFVV